VHFLTGAAHPCLDRAQKKLGRRLDGRAYVGAPKRSGRSDHKVDGALAAPVR
jgi:hypothetical protein